MKKVLYSLALVVLGLTSCATWDDPKTENYGAAPSVDIQAALATPSDSAFTVTITPGQGTGFYAYVIDQDDEIVALDSASLLKGSYGNTVVNAAEAPTTTFTIDNAEPNKQYNIYAVAASEKGIIGSVVVKSIKTTDSGAPVVGAFASDPAAKMAAARFNQNVTRGEGAVTGIYYKEWDWENPVTLASDEIEVAIEGNIVTFTAAIPAGAYAAFSWAEGAFVDETGNKCAAFTSTIDEEEFDFIGAWVHAANEAFAIADNNVTAPTASTFSDWQEFVGELSFDFAIYRDDERVKAGDLSVTYTNDSRTVTYKLAAEDWTVNDSTLTFKLPAATENKDIVSLQIGEGVIFDVFGNKNAAFSSKALSQFTTFVPTKDFVIGNFQATYYSAYDQEPQLNDAGAVTIEESAEVEHENGILVKELFYEGSELEGYYDLPSAKMVIDAFQIVGEDEYEGSKIYIVLYNQSQANEVTFTINPDGTMTSTELGLVAYTEDLKSALGWWEKASLTTLTPMKPAEAARALKNVSRTAKVQKVKPCNVRNLKVLAHQ